MFPKSLKISIVNFRKDRQRHINTTQERQRNRKAETKRHNWKQKQDLETVCAQIAGADELT